MHILDLIMYFVILGTIWFLMDKFSDGELTNDIGGIIGSLVIIVYTIYYISIFVWPPNDLNWVDIFSGKYSNYFLDWFKL